MRPQLAALLVLFAVVAGTFHFICDDAYITFRYSQHFAAGHGPRYNLGDHVPIEGYSNFLWMALGAVVEWFGGRSPTVLSWASILVGLATLVGVHDTARNRLGWSEPVSFSVTALLAMAPSFFVWSTSGLATMPHAALLLFSWRLMAFEDGRRAVVLGALCAFGLTLVRTEGVAWLGVAAVAAGWTRRHDERSLRPMLLMLGAALAAYAVYFGWRLSWFGRLLSNTAYLKVQVSPETLLRGLRYSAGFFVVSLTPLLLVPATFSAARARGAAWGIALLAWTAPGYAVVVSGDFMAFWRMIVPSLPFMVLTAGYGLAALESRREALVGPLVAVTLLVGALPAGDVQLVPRRVRARLDVRQVGEMRLTEVQKWASMKRNAAAWRQRGIALREVATPGESLVAGAIGALGYEAPQIFLYDQFGLVSREVADAPWDGELHMPGHDRVVKANFFYDQEPTLLWFRVLFTEEPRAKVRDHYHRMKTRDIDNWYYPDFAPVAALSDDERSVYAVWMRRADGKKHRAYRVKLFEERLRR